MPNSNLEKMSVSCHAGVGACQRGLFDGASFRLRFRDLCFPRAMAASPPSLSSVLRLPRYSVNSFRENSKEPLNSRQRR